jgi:hypothetical protein
MSTVNRWTDVFFLHEFLKFENVHYFRNFPGDPKRKGRFPVLCLIHKLMKNENGWDYNTWFEIAADLGQATRLTTDPLNIKPKKDRLEFRKNFFTVRIIDVSNWIPANIKVRKTATRFKAAYAKLRNGTAYPSSKMER